MAEEVAMTNEETFKIRIAPKIPGLEAMSDLDAFRAIAQFSHTFCDLATTTINLIDVSGGASDLGANMDLFERRQGGVWCAGAALMCAQMLNASGRVDKAWYYSDGIPIYSHAMALASIGGVLYHWDPYFNGEYTDERGQILPFLDVLTRIKARRPPRWRQYYAEKTMHGKHLRNLEVWKGAPIPQSVAATTETASKVGIIGRGVVTANGFRETYFLKDQVDEALIDLGYPAEPEDELWHYLRLHPITVENSNYGDLDSSKSQVLASIQAVVS